jgi:hypothetical protein
LEGRELIKPEHTVRKAPLETQMQDVKDSTGSRRCHTENQTTTEWEEKPKYLDFNKAAEIEARVWVAMILKTADWKKEGNFGTQVPL